MNMLTITEIEIINELIKTKPTVLLKIIPSKYPVIYEKIQNNIGNTFSEKLWLLLNDNIIPVCKYCNGPVKFVTITLGYKQYCSMKCKSNSPLVLAQMKKTCMNKYGVDNIFKTAEFIEKNKKLNAGNTSEARLKAYNTKLDKYGNPNYNNREKNNQTKLARYNDINYCNKEKIIETNQKKYNANSYTATPEGKDKVKDTILKKYGYTNALKVPEILLKIKNTLKLKYDVTNPGLIVGHKENVSKKVKEAFYNKLINSPRLNNLVIPLFTKDDYMGIKKEHPFKCVKCNHIFNDILNNGKIPRCPECYPIRKTGSAGEDEVYDYCFNELKISNIIRNDRHILNGKELDIYLPDYKLAIEFNGLYWHSCLAGNIDQFYHLNKTLTCEKEGIHLIHIFDDEWHNKKDIIKSKLKYLVNQSSTKLYARHCVIKEISATTKNDFLFQYHIQGEDKSKFKYGLFYKDELVSVMTFGALRLNMGNKVKNKSEYELIRYASKYTIVGGAGKLIKYFIDNVHPKKIISYADRRFTNIDKNIYKSVGFIKTSDGTPNYWYLSKYDKRLHRFNFRKSQLSTKLAIYDPTLTEWENMQLNGYDRIWDCGSLKYEYNL